MWGLGFLLYRIEGHILTRVARCFFGGGGERRICTFGERAGLCSDGRLNEIPDFCLTDCWLVGW